MTVGSTPARGALWNAKRARRIRLVAAACKADAFGLRGFESLRAHTMTRGVIGSTTESGSVGLGSSPGGSATNTVVPRGVNGSPPDFGSGRFRFES